MLRVRCIGAEWLGAISVVQKRTPDGGQRGSVVSVGGGGAEELETGTLGEEWKVAKEEPDGPNGENCGIWVSLAKMEVPDGSWLVRMRRGGGNGEDVGDMFAIG